MTTTWITPDNEEHWLSLRRQDLTSTEASALFNLSPYETKFELWHRKHDGLQDSFIDNERIEAGRHIEPAIASLVAARYDVNLKPLKSYARIEGERMGSSFDYECEDGAVFGFPGTKGIIECKNVDGLIFKRKWTDDETPAHIEIQLQHQMEVSGYAWGAVAALVGGNRLEMYVRVRDEEVGVAIRKAIADFWCSVDSNEAPPPVMPDDASFVVALNQFSDGSVLDARDNDTLAQWMSEYDQAAARKKAAETDMLVAKAAVIEIAGSAGQVVWSGGKVSLTQVADNPGKEVTPEMVGTRIGARKGYRNFRSYPSKKESVSQ